MLNSFIKAGLTYAFSDVLRKLAPFLLLPFYVSQLSVGQFGKLEYLTIVTTFFSFLISWGSVQGLLRLYPEFGKAVVFQSITLSFMIFAILSIILSFLYLLIDPHEILAIESKKIFYLCLFFGFIFSINNIALTILRSEERLIEFTIFNIAAVFLQISLIIYFIYFTKLDYLSKFYGVIGANFISLLFLSVYVLKDKVAFNLSHSLMLKLLKFYSPIAGGNLIGWFSGSLDKIIVKSILGDAALGIYAFAFQLAQIFKLGIESFLKAFNVLVYNNQNLQNLFFKKRYYSMFIFQILAVIYFYIIISLINMPLIKEYAIESSIFILILLSRIFLLMNFVETIFFYTKKNSLTVMKASLISLFVISIIIYPSITYFGLMGAGLSILIFSITNYFYLTHKHKIGLLNVIKNILFIIMPWVFMI